ncbi:MAG: hypothetical protein ABFC98_08285 [Candidatus Cloacimonas sp.]
MKKIIFILITLISYLHCLAFPVNEPVIDELTYINNYNLLLINNRVINDGKIVCADSNNVYIEIEDEMMLSIPKSQIIKITPDLPFNSFIYYDYLYGYCNWNEENIRIFNLKPSCKYIIRAYINDIDCCGGVTISIELLNLSKNRLKYALYNVKYYNAVNDLIYNEIGDYSYMHLTICHSYGYPTF